MRHNMKSVSARVPTVVNGIIIARDFQSLITPSNSPLPRSRSSRASRRHAGSTFAHRDIGWLGVYLLAYLPVMFLLRAALKIA